MHHSQKKMKINVKLEPGKTSVIFPYCKGTESFQA